MNLLLDTHVLLWAAADAPRLGEDARDLISDENNALWFSAASIWEVAIKTGLGRPDFAVDPQLLRRGLLENGYNELSISARHAAGGTHLPAIHRDPFDRLLVAQATDEGLLLLTADDEVAFYPGPIRKV